MFNKIVAALYRCLLHNYVCLIVFFLQLQKSPKTLWTQYGKNGYVMVDDRMTWNDAQEFCVHTFKGNLPVFTSDSENNAVIQFINATRINSMWLGGSYNYSTNDWSWVTGEPWNYTNFMGSIEYSTDKYLNIKNQKADPLRRWSAKDANDDGIRRFVCETSNW